LSNWKCHTGFFDEVEGLSVTVKMAQYLTYSGFHLVLDSAFSAWSGVDESICPSNKVTDGGAQLFISLAEKHGLQIVATKMPPKSRGNLDTLGHAYNLAFNEHKEYLSSLNPDYLAMVDVDTKLPADYFHFIMNLMDRDKLLGCVAAHIKGERTRSNWPRGSGKVVRWDIVQKIGEFWDLDADTFFNIKALRHGYGLMVVDEVVTEAEESHLLTRKGRFRFGRLNYYERKNPLLVLQMALVLARKRQWASDYLRGYFQEWSKGTWKCKDSDVRYFYSLEYRIREKLVRTLGIGQHNWKDD
jgi:hypothetical protein